MHTGETDIGDLGRISTWQGRTRTDAFQGECGKVSKLMQNNIQYSTGVKYSTGVQCSTGLQYSTGVQVYSVQVSKPMRDLRLIIEHDKS